MAPHHPRLQPTKNIESQQSGISLARPDNQQHHLRPSWFHIYARNNCTHHRHIIRLRRDSSYFSCSSRRPGDIDDIDLRTAAPDGLVCDEPVYRGRMTTTILLWHAASIWNPWLRWYTVLPVFLTHNFHPHPHHCPSITNHLHPLSLFSVPNSQFHSSYRKKVMVLTTKTLKPHQFHVSSSCLYLPLTAKKICWVGSTDVNMFFRAQRT